MHVRYKSQLYISLLSFAEQQREMTKFYFVPGTWTKIANFMNFRISNLFCAPNSVSWYKVLTVMKLGYCEIRR